MKKKFLFLPLLLLFTLAACTKQNPRTIEDFNTNWKFRLGDDTASMNPDYADTSWRNINLPHDWSIEGPFDEKNPAGVGGGALPGGIGWYRKTFSIPASSKNKNVFIDFDGVYCLSKVWINGHYLGERPNGYISFRYDLTPYLNYGEMKNVIAVQVNNSLQPNSRWYSGSGIYRNVWLVTTDKIFVDHWGTFITTPEITTESATVLINISIRNTDLAAEDVVVKTMLYNSEEKTVGSESSALHFDKNEVKETQQKILLPQPHLWSTDHPYLYKAATQIISNGKLVDEYITPFGVRYFSFDAEKGFFLNGKAMKLNGVNNHHDLGALGAAINTRAIERQLELLKAMGCNAIRTSHNPPAPELLNLCDQMGFVVMDEAFDMWKRPKNPFDYHLYWEEWFRRDLTDQILRDRNHPSVMVWSVGNEIPEQSAYVWKPNVARDQLQIDSSGKNTVRELVKIVRSLDTTRPVTAACDHTDTSNMLLQSSVLDIICYNYRHKQWSTVQDRWGKKPFIATESASAFETRGHYDMPSDSIRRWPPDWSKPFTTGNADHTCSSYDNCCASWGSTHEESLKEYMKYDFIAGTFVWTGIDYLGEPTPYGWPSRSSYFGIIDLAGFPKDAFYLYQSLWTNKPVLHLLPHWNWEKGDTIDVWAYYSQADEVELFLNEKSLGVRKKSDDDLHVMWRVNYEPGTLTAVSTKGGDEVLRGEVKTAGASSKINLEADRNVIHADGKGLSFITVTITDESGNPVPDAENELQFTVKGEGFIAGVDNGSQTSMESFKASHRKAFSGKCLVIIQSNGNSGSIQINATSANLKSASTEIKAK